MNLMLSVPALTPAKTGKLPSRASTWTNSIPFNPPTETEYLGFSKITGFESILLLIIFCSIIFPDGSFILKIFVCVWTLVLITGSTGSCMKLFKSEPIKTPKKNVKKYFFIIKSRKLGCSQRSLIPLTTQ